jgi:hypothetical protein
MDGDVQRGWGMAGRNRRLAWMAPALLGILVQGGCHLFGRQGAAGNAARPDAIGPAVSPDVTAKNGKFPDSAPGPDGPQFAATARDGDPAITPVVVQSPAMPPAPAGTDENTKGAPGPATPPTSGRIEPLPAPAKPEPHQRAAPTATGALLNLAPGESPIERLTAVALRLEGVEAERKALQARAESLSATLGEREKALQQAVREVQDSAEEMQRTRTAAQTLKQEVEEVRAALSRRDKDEIETLRAINKLLERMTEEKNRPPAGNDERSPWRPK